MPGTALWVDGFICLPVSPFICLPLSPRLDACTALWVDAFVCLPGFTCLPLSPFICLPLSPSLDDPVWVDGFICLPLSFVSRCLPAWMPGTALWVDGFICLPLSPFICLPTWMSGAARVHLSPFVSLHLSPVVSQPGCLGGQIHLSPFVPLHLSPVVSQPGSGTALWVDGFICLPLSPLIFSRCLPAWMPGTALWVDGFICLPLSPFICLPLSPSLDAWRGSLGGRVHLSTFVSQDVWHPFVSLHLSPVVSQPGCLALLFWWTDSLFSLCLPSFGSCCLPAWMSVTALQADGFTCLPWFPFICLPSLFIGRIHLFPFVSLYLSPVVMPGTALWVDGFICLPLSTSLDVWHSRSAVSFTSRGSVLLAGSGLPSASALASVIPCLVDVGDRVLLCLPFIWTSISLGLVVGRLPCLSLATPCLFVQCLVISCGPELTIAVRCGATRRLC